MRHRFRMKIIASLFAPAIALAMAAPVHGAGTATSAGAVETPKTAATRDTQKVATAQRMKQSDMRASKVIGMDVRNAQGENLGEVKDLVVDVKNGRVYYAVLSFGGFLGLGDKLFAYPVRAFSPAPDGDKLILNVDKAKLKGAPGFDSKVYPNWSEGYAADVDRYFGSTLALEPVPGQVLRRATEFIGKDVVDRSAKDVGEIEDLVVTMESGRIHYAVLEFDRSWNLNDKLLAVPLGAFEYLAGRDDLVLSVDRSKLDAKRAFDKKRWPDLNDPEYIVDVDRYLVLVVPERAGKADTSASSSPRPNTVAAGNLRSSNAGAGTAK